MGQIKNIKLHIVTDIKYYSTQPPRTGERLRRGHPVLENDTISHILYVFVVVGSLIISKRRYVRPVVFHQQGLEVSTGVLKQKEERQLVLGRMRHLKKVHRRSMNGFREGTFAKSQKRSTSTQ